MIHLIDKDALVADIEKRIRTYRQVTGYDRRTDALISLKNFIDTLEVKDVNLNKELSYEDYRGFFEKYPDLSDDWGFDESWMFANYFFELGLKAQKVEEDVNSPEEECNIVYKNITIINKDGECLKTKIEQREKV